MSKNTIMNTLAYGGLTRENGWGLTVWGKTVVRALFFRPLFLLRSP